MTVREIIHCEQGSDNYVKAKKIAMRAKDKAKKANPGDEYIPTGFNADSHQGSHVMSFINR